MTTTLLPALSVADVMGYAKQAGFIGEGLVTITAIAGAESGYIPNRLGDLTIQTDKWGPSVGLTQVRSLKAELDTGKTRDFAHLIDPAFNMRSAYAISGGGRTFTPWSTYTNGAWKQFQSAAYSAFANDPVFPGDTPVSATKPVPAGVPLAIAAKGGPLIPLSIGGRSLDGELGEAVIGGKIDLTTDKVSEVTVTLLDDANYTLTRKYRLALDSTLRCLNLPFRVVTFSCAQHKAGAAITLLAHPAGVVIMRKVSSAAGGNVSPTDHMRALTAQAGLRFVGEPSGSRSTVGPNTIQDAETQQDRPETDWELGQRLAGELGYYAFESAGTFFFATGRYLKAVGRKVQILQDPRTARAGQGTAHEAINRPSATATQSRSVPLQFAGGAPDPYFSDIKIDATVSGDTGTLLRPGDYALFDGVPPFFDGYHQMITKVTWDLIDRTSPVQIAAGTLAAKQGTARTAADNLTTGNDPSITAYIPAPGVHSALQMVTECLRQVGDRYVWGAETNPNDPDPHAFDCSELVQWACAQVGVSFVDGSANQYAAIVRAKLTMSVADAAKTRGALLFITSNGKPTGIHHVVVSLGDGVNTVEAKGTKYGVVSGGTDGRITGRGFTLAGKIPGLDYTA